MAQRAELENKGVSKNNQKRVRKELKKEQRIQDCSQVKQLHHHVCVVMVRKKTISLRYIQLFA